MNAATNPTEDLVVCTDASRTFGTGPAAVVAVQGTTAQVSPGARIAIAGPSGSGKSTLLHLMAGLEVPTRGKVTWPSFSTDAAERARDIGVVFQSPSLVPALDVAENTRLPLVLAGVSEQECRDRVAEALELVGVSDLAAKLPEELSGGQAQRVAVARVLALRPRLVLADEPTGQLDHATGQHLIDVLLATTAQIGAALVVTTHDRTVLERLDTHWTMHEGQLRTAVTQGATS
ncbi:MAG: ATP-binding cassette domain-containing protein [Actinomycetota bacterium]